MHYIGEIVKVTVCGIEPYGIFVKLSDDYSGLIHISEIDNNFINDLNDYVKLNDIIYANVISIDEIKNHLSLSIKNMNYKGIKNNLNESISSFLPLAKQLPIWINE